MTEALGAVTKELFLDGYEEILIEAVKENIGSNRVIEKCGFVYTGSREEAISQWKMEIVTILSYNLKKAWLAENA